MIWQRAITGDCDGSHASLRSVRRYFVVDGEPGSTASNPALGLQPCRFDLCASAEHTYQFPDSVLLVFCKAPIAGQVKTRSQPELSAEQAVAAHINLTQMTLDRAFQQKLCPVVLCCSPDNEHPFLQQCVKDYPLILPQQSGSDLGERMHNALTDALSGYRHAVLIGCDCPSLTIDNFRQALSALQNISDSVIAPTEDGGYVLIGLNAPQPR